MMLKVADPTPKKRRSAAATAPSSSGTACPPLCHSVVMFSQRDGTLHSCAGLTSLSALPSTCNDGTVIDWGTSRSMLVGRRSHGMLQKLMKNWRDGERAATAAAMNPPSEMPQMPLTGACWSIQRSTCRTLSQIAAARLASSSALALLYSPAAARPSYTLGNGLTACGASRNSTLRPRVLSSASQPVSSSILRISELSPASPCSTRSTISAEREASGGVERDSAGLAGACCASRKAASCRAVGWSKTSVLGSAGAPSPSACCSWLRSSTAPSESSPASSSGASASTAPPAVRAASASTVSSDNTAATGAAAPERTAAVVGLRALKADKNSGTTPPASTRPHETGIIATTGGAPAPTASPSAAS
eukprot:scaffold4305_cov74-Phaeocystis_antarctica.AAC.5